jgi:N utilization substance protein B
MSNTPREIRRLAFQVLYQLDARNGQDPEAVLASTMKDDEDSGDATDFSQSERKKAFELASLSWADREKADAFMLEAAPGWPAHRQAAVDRAILRLAHYEMTSGRTHPKIAVNEAVELAKTFSTDKSPAFVNGLLDKLLKAVLAERGETDTTDGETAADSGGSQPDTVEAA